MRRSARKRAHEEARPTNGRRAAADERRSQTGGRRAASDVTEISHYREVFSCQSCNDRRDTDHGGRRTADPGCARRGDGLGGGRRDKVVTVIQLGIMDKALTIHSLLDGVRSEC
ncbi:hypothetical protein Scep_008686 [Stephania cephalantha]|uniref:Uncharacterized protein n=1 Tax=Stephania cephalantha TaxID=152367 RepID=A0AAP0KE56_9MAGN